jgi:hypothetical protein
VYYDRNSHHCLARKWILVWNGTNSAHIGIYGVNTKLCEVHCLKMYHISYRLSGPSYIICYFVGIWSRTRCILIRDLIYIIPPPQYLQISIEQFHVCLLCSRSCSCWVKVCCRWNITSNCHRAVTWTKDSSGGNTLFEFIYIYGVNVRVE